MKIFRCLSKAPIGIRLAVFTYWAGLSIRSAMLENAKQIEISFTDTGPGIPEEIQEKIFQPFFSTKEGKNSGLGMSVSLTIIEQHQGNITLESEIEKGTTFRVALPVHDG